MRKARQIMAAEMNKRGQVSGAIQEAGKIIILVIIIGLVLAFVFQSQATATADFAAGSIEANVTNAMKEAATTGVNQVGTLVTIGFAILIVSVVLLLWAYFRNVGGK